MRHYDRADFRHLDDADRYRDPEYMADDGWVGPNEHGNWATEERRQVTPDTRNRSRPAPAYGQQSPAYGQSAPWPSYEGRGPRREPSRPATHERTGLFDALLHPRRAMRRVVRGLFAGKGPKNWVQPEHRIHDDVCERLAQHHDVDATDIEVTVKDAEVTLSGAVPERRMKYMAEDAAAEAMGVKDVHNRLRVAR